MLENRTNSFKIPLNIEKLFPREALQGITDQTS
jgi:hypothetical protein